MGTAVGILWMEGLGVSLDGDATGEPDSAGAELSGPTGAGLSEAIGVTAAGEEAWGLRGPAGPSVLVGGGATIVPDGVMISDSTMV